MKIILTALIVLLPFFIKSQNNNVIYDKIIVVIIKDFSEECGEDPGDALFCLTDEKGDKIAERYSCVIPEVQPKDLITENWVLNPKYKGKKATLYCNKHSGGAGWVVQKVVFDSSNGVSNTNATNAQAKPAQAKIGVFTLISGGCHEDGCTFKFKNDKGADFYVSSLPKDVVKFNNTPEGGTEVQKKYLNKKFSLKYEIKKVFHEESNSNDEEMVISEMKLIQ